MRDCLVAHIKDRKYMLHPKRVEEDLVFWYKDESGLHYFAAQPQMLMFFSTGEQPIVFSLKCEMKRAG